MTRTIPGRITAHNLAALFGDKPEAATVHGPKDRRDYRKAARDLMARGHTTHDIAVTLRLTNAGVLELLAETEPSPK